MQIPAQIGYIVDHFEGGDIYTDSVIDRGGPTKYGVTLRTLQHYRRQREGDPSLVVTPQDVEQMTRGEAIDCAYTLFAVEAGIVYLLHEGVQFAVLDFGFHSGWQTAIKELQRACRVMADGILGPVTQHAVNSQPPSELVLAVCTARAELLHRLMERDPAQRAHARGWWRRVTTVQRKALEM